LGRSVSVEIRDDDSVAVAGFVRPEFPAKLAQDVVDAHCSVEAAIWLLIVDVEDHGGGAHPDQRAVADAHNPVLFGLDDVDNRLDLTA